MSWLKTTLVASLVLGFAGTAMAQQTQQRVIYKKRTIIDIPGRVIEGTLARPEGAVIDVRQSVRFPAAIQPRANFWLELAASDADL